MRIILASIYDASRSGGLSSHVAEVAEGLTYEGHDVSMITPYSHVSSWKRRFVMDLPRLPLRLFDRDSAYRYFVQSASEMLSSALRKIPPGTIDVYHAHDPAALLCGIQAFGRDGDSNGAPIPMGALRTGRPLLVLTVHGDIANMAESDGAIRPEGPGRQFAEEVESNAYRAADALFAVDQRLRLHCTTLGGEREIRVMRNFVNTERFRPAGIEDAAKLSALRRELELAEGDRVLLVPRRLVKKNGVLFAVRAMAESPIRAFGGGRIVLAIAGTGPERETIDREANRLGVSEAARGPVRMLSDVPRDSLSALYQLADCVLIPSVPDAGVIEATSLSALEAMATGKPVIASSIGGLAELITDGRTGVLVPPGDAHAIAGAAVRILSDDAFAASIGKEARAFVESTQSSRMCVRQLIEIYRRSGAPS